MEKEYDWLWLCAMPELFDKDKRLLLQYFQTPAQIRSADEMELLEIPCLSMDKIRSIRKHQQTYDPQKEYGKYREMGVQFVSCCQEGYPLLLREIYDYPLGLFYKGELPQKDEVCVAIVGARMCTQYGYDQAEALAQRLAQNHISVVSGLAAGIDGVAQNAALKAHGKSYGILGCGPDICYPRGNRFIYEALNKNGGILSEYCPGIPAVSWHFPARNRIISGLCKKIIVVEAKQKSGTLITADLALEQGRDVYAFPGRTKDETSRGCNWLIAQGAGIITDIEEFLEETGLKTTGVEKKKKSNQVLARPEKLLYSCLDSRAKSLEELVNCSKMTVQETIRVLYALKKKDLIKETEKNYYTKK